MLLPLNNTAIPIPAPVLPLSFLVFFSLETKHLKPNDCNSVAENHGEAHEEKGTAHYDTNDANGLSQELWTHELSEHGEWIPR